MPRTLAAIRPTMHFAAAGLRLRQLDATSGGMCGRYTYRLTWAEVVELYRLTLPEEQPEGLKPNWNVAPTHVMPIVRPAGNGRELLMAGWGLVPFWMKPEQMGKQAYSTINARDDRIQTAATYREPFKKRRVLVPASGWCEWQKIRRQDAEAAPLPAGGTPFDWMRGPPELAAEMMKPYGGEIDLWEVGRDVGNVRNNRPELVDRVALI